MLVQVTADHAEDAIHQLALICVSARASSDLSPEDYADLYCEATRRIRKKLIPQIATDRPVYSDEFLQLDGLE